MALLDKLGGALKKGAELTAKGIKKGAELTAKGVGQAADNISHGRDVTALNRRLLSPLSAHQLKQLHDQYGGLILQLDDDSKPDREDYLGAVAGKLSFSEAIEEAKRHHVSWNTINDAQREYDNLEKKYTERKENRWQGKSSKEIGEMIEQEVPVLHELVDFLAEVFEAPKEVVDERELQNTVYSALKYSGKFKSVDQEQVMENERPDIVADNIIIELKVPKNQSNLDAAFFQAGHRYKSLKKDIVLFIYAIDDYMEKLAEQYDNKFSEEVGIQTIIQRGGRRKAKVKFRMPRVIQLKY